MFLAIRLNLKMNDVPELSLKEAICFLHGEPSIAYWVVHDRKIIDLSKEGIRFRIILWDEDNGGLFSFDAFLGKDGYKIFGDVVSGQITLTKESD